MASSGQHTSSLVAQWRAARRLYPIYGALATQFGLEAPPYENLDDSLLQSDPNFLGRVEHWFDTIDVRLTVAQFRQVLHASAIASSESKLQALIERHYTKVEKTEADRDKLDFLLVQYFAVSAPPTAADSLRLEDAAEVLAPVLGQVNLAQSPQWMQPLEGWVAKLPQFTSLRELQESQLAQQGRQLKAAARQEYFAPISLVAFTRFSYLMRRTFFQLINAELKILGAALDKLTGYGQTVLDCSSAQMSAQCSISELRRFCESYQKPALPEYSVDTSILRLIQLRQIVDGALAEIEQPDDPVLAEIEERCRNVEAQLIAMRKLAAGLAAQRRRSPDQSKAAAKEKAIAAFEELMDVPVEVQAATPKSEPLPATVEAVPQPLPPAAAPAVPEIMVSEAAPPPPGPDPSLTDAMEEIRKKLVAAPRKGISSLNIAGTALLLSPDEVEAFIRPKDASSIDLQRSLAARALLLQAVELQKKTNSPALLSKTIQLCRTEAASIQQHSTEAKVANNPLIAATLNASASQLLSLLRQVERMSNAS